MGHSFLRRMLMAACLTVALAGCSEPAPPGETASDEPLFMATLVFKLVETREPGLVDLAGIAVGPDGRIYLAFRSGLAVFDRQWNLLSTWPTPQPAVAVAIHEDGRVFATERQRVYVFDAQGKELVAWGRPGNGPGEFGQLTGITLSGPNVWLADPAKQVIHRFDTTGDFVEDIGRGDRAAGIESIVCPSLYLDCAAAVDGTLYIGNPGRCRVEAYNLNGRLVGRWGRPGMGATGFAPCCNPTNIAVRPGGGFVTAEKGNPRVKIYDTEGRVLGIMDRRYFSSGSAGMDLAVDADDRVYVVDPAAGKVLVFEQDKES